jgi:hypothetical protein
MPARGIVVLFEKRPQGLEEIAELCEREVGPHLSKSLVLACPSQSHVQMLWTSGGLLPAPMLSVGMWIGTTRAPGNEGRAEPCQHLQRGGRAGYWR